MATPPARPPPIPRRHPSRPSLSAAISSSGSVSSVAASPSPEPPPPLPLAATTASAEQSLRSTPSDFTTRATFENSASIRAARRSSAVLIGAPTSPPASPNLSRQSMGIGAATVGLGPVLLDFKDWVKAGQASGGGSTVVAGDNERDERDESDGHTQHPAVERHDAVVRSSIMSADRSSGHSKYSSNPSAETDASRQDSRDSYMSGYSSTSNAAHNSSLYRSSLPSSHSISSLSIDSSRSPLQPGRRTSSRLSERDPYFGATGVTPRRASQDLSRELSASRASHRLSLHNSPHESPGGSGQDSPSGTGSRHQASPMERRFSRRLGVRRDSSGVATELVEEEEVETIQQNKQTMTLDERIRDAEEKLARRASLRSETPLRRLNSTRASPSPRQSVVSPPIVNGNASHGSSDSPLEPSGAAQRVRAAIPSEFQNGRSFTPSPNAGHRRSHLVDLNSSPRAALSTSESRRELDLSSPRAYRPMVTSSGGRPQSVLENRDSGNWSRPQPYSRGGDLEHFATPQRDFPVRSRPESVLETSAEHNRYSNGFTPQRQTGQEERSNRLSALLSSDRDYRSRNSFAMSSTRSSRDFGKRDSGYSRGSRDFSNRDSLDFSARSSRDFGSRVGLSPNDSVSVVGVPKSEIGSLRNDGPSKDPLEMIRRLEESRTQHNKRWEEDRSASVLGDYRSESRYGEREIIRERHEDTPQGRSSSRLSRLEPRSISSMSSVRDSYVTSSPRSAPTTRRRTDSGSSTMESPLVGRSSRASGSLTGPSTDPRLHRRSQTSFGARSHGSSDQASTTDHGRNLVDAARVLEKKGEVDPVIIAKLGAAASGSERSNAGIRAAVLIAQELVLDVEIGDESAVKTVKDRLPRLAVTLREAGRASDQAVRDLTEALLAARGSASTSTGATNTGVSTPSRSQGQSHRRGNTLDSPRTDALRHSPSMSTTSLHSPLLRYRSQTPLGERSSSHRRDSTSSARYDSAPRVLDPIEQSPPKTTNQRSSPSVAASALGVSSPADSPRTPVAVWTARHSPSLSSSEHVLRKQSSLASTHTVRANSFQPAHAPEPTTALSSSPAYGSVPLARGSSSQESLRISQNDDKTPKREDPGTLQQELERAQAFENHKQVVVDELEPSQEHVNRESVLSTGSEYSAESPVSAEPEPAGGDISRKGTFGAMAGSLIRPSVSERFRKHLNGE